MIFSRNSLSKRITMVKKKLDVDITHDATSRHFELFCLLTYFCENRCLSNTVSEQLSKLM